MIEPLRFAFEVNCPVADAFTIWTSRASQWWPPSHSVSGTAGIDVIFEPHVGGRVFERTPAGEEFDWGEITAWEPPRRLGYLWHIRRDRADATDVAITFVDQGTTTRVEVEHTGWERLGADAQTWRDANTAGWTGLLPHFRKACGEAA